LAAERWPVVVADRSDNPGAGAAGDSTYLLSELLRRADRHSLDGVALALLWDPMAVEVCHAAGEGATVRLRIGGKAGVLSGPPLDVVARVEVVRRDARQALFAQGPPRLPLGLSTSVVVDGMRIVMSSERQQVFSPHVFTEHGIDPTAARILVVKSTVHFLAGFGELAAQIVRCDGPGTSSTDLSSFPFQRVQRPLYPLDRVDEADLQWIVRSAT
jgi:microcystin degradation protein MlrC